MDATGEAKMLQDRVENVQFEELYKKNSEWWEDTWKKSDIEIKMFHNKRRF